jgi:hypothetical protein
MLKVITNLFKKKVEEPKRIHLSFIVPDVVKHDVVKPSYRGRPTNGFYKPASTDSTIFYGSSLFEYLVWDLYTHYKVGCTDAVARNSYIFAAMKGKPYEMMEFDLTRMLQVAEKDMKAQLVVLRSKDTVAHGSTIYESQMWYALKDGCGQYIGATLNPNLKAPYLKIRNQILEEMGLEYTNG